MRLIIELFLFRFELEGRVYWTKWFLPIHFYWMRTLESGMLTISFLWLIHIHLRFPLPMSKKEAARLVSGGRLL